MSADATLNLPTAAPAAAQRSALALGLMFASGFAGLGHQVVWTQRCALWLGHEAAAVLAVVAAFFGGLAVGAWTLGARIGRSTRPGRWYAVCEIATGLWAAALLWLMAPASGWLLGLTGAQPTPAWQWAIAFAGTFVLLLPATAAMGATLPAIERALAAQRERGASIAALYAGNTFGAVAGVLACAFWLVPAFGLTATTVVCIALSLACGAIAWAWPAAAPAMAPAVAPTSAARLRWQLAATGLLGIGYEVLAVRVISQVAENTVYTYAMLLAVYLVGSALGAAAWARWRAARGDSAFDGDLLFVALAWACGLGGAGLWAAESLQTAVQQALGAGYAAALAGEATVAFAAFLLPTVVMGALFSHLATRARSAGLGLHRALGINTLGAAAAPLVVGVLAVPALGAKFTLLAIVAGYLALAAPRGRPARAAMAGAAATLIATALWAGPLTFVEVPEGGRIVSHEEGAMAAVSVVAGADGVMRLRIDNRQQEGSSATLLADARQALLPMLLHPAPHRALFLGVGTGVTASAAAAEAALQVDAVDLIPEVITASALFTGATAAPATARPHLMVADARRFVRASPTQYDLIVSDNFHPARSGSGSLYTVEHFRAVQARLARGGVFCQWLPLHQLDLQTLRSIVRSFIAAYPGGYAMLATNSLETPVLGLVAREDGGRFDLGEVQARLAGVALPRPPAAFGLADEFALLGSFFAGPSALQRWAAAAPLNTDDHPVVAYRAPRITYAPDSAPRDRLVALLGELAIAPDELLGDGLDAARSQRLAAYWAARNHYLDLGRGVQPSANVRQMLAQVQAPLLSVLQRSPDFRPAYDPLLRMATALARDDVPAAQALLAELARLQPARPEAAAALRQLAADPP